MKSRGTPSVRLCATMNPVSGAIAVALGSTVVVPAQAAETTGFYDEVVVTATRRETGTQDVPYNIAALSGDTLEAQRITNLNEFARWVPGLTLTDQGRRGSNQLTVRGLNASSVDATDTLINSSGGKVQTYVGEIPVYVDLALYDMERVEVLIGPQGTLYGSGTLAGAVRYLPNRPNFDGVTLDTHVRGYSLSESDDLGWGADATFNLPLIADTLAWRTTVGYVAEAGFTDYNFLVREPGVSNPEPDFSDPDDVAANLFSVEDADDEKTLMVRTALRWDIDDEMSATLTYTLQNQDVGGRSINHMDSFGTGEYVSAHRFLEPNERENEILALEITADLGFAELTSATGYTEYDEIGQRDQTDLLLNFEYGYEDFPEFAAFTRETVEDDSITQEIRLVSQNDGPVSWITGIFYSDFDRDERSSEFTPGIPEFFEDEFGPDYFGVDVMLPLPTGDLEYFARTQVSTTELALFGEVGYQINDRWQVTGGLRWFDYEDTTTIVTDLPLFSGPGTPETRRTADDDTTWKINAAVDLDGLISGMDSGTAYGTISTGYGLGGGNAISSCPVPIPPGQNVCVLPNEENYDVEETTNWEVGLKSEWLDNSLLVNVAFYYIEWDDVQLSTRSVNGDVPIVTNAGKAASTGAEFLTRWQINDNWAMLATYAYNSAELTENVDGIVGIRFAPPNADAFDGDRLPGTPEEQGSFNINYTRSIMTDKTLEANYGFTAISDIYTKVGNRGSGESLPGYAVHNASVSVSGDQWTATLFADNLFDKFARTGVRTDTDYLDSIGVNDFTLRRYYANVLRPRSIGLDFRYDFDF